MVDLTPGNLLSLLDAALSLRNLVDRFDSGCEYFASVVKLEWHLASNQGCLGVRVPPDAYSDLQSRRWQHHKAQ